MELDPKTTKSRLSMTTMFVSVGRLVADYTRRSIYSRVRYLLLPTNFLVPLFQTWSSRWNWWCWRMYLFDLEPHYSFLYWWWGEKFRCQQIRFLVIKAWYQQRPPLLDFWTDEIRKIYEMRWEKNLQSFQPIASPFLRLGPWRSLSIRFSIIAGSLSWTTRPNDNQ